MRPYFTIKLTEAPDNGDIRSEARKSSIGRTKRAETYIRYLTNKTHIVKTCRNDRGYTKPRTKASVRRTIKRSEKARHIRLIVREEE